MESEKVPSPAGSKVASSQAASDALLGSFLTPGVLGYPAHRPTSAWHQHAPFAFWLIAVHRPAVVVELGTFYGLSYLAFCEAIERAGVSARAYAIDHWQGDAHAGTIGQDVLDELRRIHDPLYGGFSSLVESTFDDAAEHFAGGEIDLLHIDGAHDSASVESDFDTWLPKMSARGVMVLHDINVRRSGFGVWELWNRVATEYPHFAFDHGHGLGVLGVGSDISSLQPLFDLTGTSMAMEVRRLFARLGAGVADRAELELVQQLKRDTDARLNATESSLSATEASLIETAARLDAVLTEIEPARDNVARLSTEIEEVRQANQELRGELMAMRSSRSWRVTAPIRVVGRAIRRAMRWLRR